MPWSTSSSNLQKYTGAVSAYTPGEQVKKSASHPVVPLQSETTYNAAYQGQQHAASSKQPDMKRSCMRQALRDDSSPAGKPSKTKVVAVKQYDHAPNPHKCVAILTAS